MRSAARPVGAARAKRNGVLPASPCLRDAQGEHPGNRGGLAGAGTTGDQQQRAAQGECGRAGLVITIDGIREQRREQRRDRFDACSQHRLGCDAQELQREAAFVFAIAAQVQQAVLEDERRGHRLNDGRCRGGDEARCSELLQPGIGIRPWKVGVDQQARLRGIEAGMALRDRERGERSSGQHVIRRRWIETTQGVGQCIVQRAQHAGLLQGAQQAHGEASARKSPSPPPSPASGRGRKSASSASTNSGGKRCAWMPGESLRLASRPRQKT
jgi:hypothetical protein